MAATVLLGGLLSFLSSANGQFVSIFQGYDILFNIDVSGSIALPWDLWLFEKQYVRDLASSLADPAMDARMGFFLYSTDVNKSRNIQSWYYPKDVGTYVDGLYLESGWSNVGRAIEESLDELGWYYNGRPQMLLLFADGTPCNGRDDCPSSVCSYADRIQDSGVIVIVVAFRDECATGEDPQMDRCFVSSYYECVSDAIIFETLSSPAQAVTNVESAHDAGFVRKQETSWLEVHWVMVVAFANAILIVCIACFGGFAIRVCLKRRKNSPPVAVAVGDADQGGNKGETETVEMMGFTN